ncbi:hypothetical protein GCM10010385_60390 [Streptomyces geysiriensis]|nr:hypothetical protein GCM10010385_60390 [Streptomyces geysiriensis]
MTRSSSARGRPGRSSSRLFSFYVRRHLPTGGGEPGSEALPVPVAARTPAWAVLGSAPLVAACFAHRMASGRRRNGPVSAGHAPIGCAGSAPRVRIATEAAPTLRDTPAACRVGAAYTAVATFAPAQES